jgi:hypothetical protein
LIDDHAGRAANHTLPQACDEAAGTHIAGIAKQRACVVRSELNRPFAFNETRRTAAVDCHLVFRRGLKIMQADGSAKNATDCADPEPHLHVVGLGTGLHELFAAGKALGNSICVCKKTPDGQRLDSGECELPLDLHLISVVPTVIPRVRSPLRQRAARTHVQDRDDNLQKRECHRAL